MSKEATSGNKGKRSSRTPAHSKTSKTSQPSRAAVSKKSIVPVVGVGASAGGLEAYREFLRALPNDTGMSYVLIQHLAFSHKSLLSELLAKETSMKVEEAKNNMSLQPNHVYVIAPSVDMTMTGNALKTTLRKKSARPHMPIDLFFHSLAKNRKDIAVGIVLSGTASDGTLGFKAIKDAGGVTFVQNETAEYSDMPQSAIRSGQVDYILPPREIARELAKIAGHLHEDKSTKATKKGDIKSGEHPLEAGEERQQGEILNLLYSQTGTDFRQYKAATVERRIRKRMALNNLSTMKDYAQFLRTQTGEGENLARDMLIHVTSFYRYNEAYDYLRKKVLPSILKSRASNDPVRIWVPGCATGQEAYSIAIIVSEFLAKHSSKIPVQIFATDLSPTAIETARKGVYSKADVAGIPAEILKQFFDELDSGASYRAGSSIRDLCTFAAHDIFRNAPFARLDFVSCSNVLIYLEPSLQKKALAIFHYALRPSGFLMLGKSESVSAASGLFSQIDKKYKIYSSKETSAKTVPDLRAASHRTKSKASDDILPDMSQGEYRGPAKDGDAQKEMSEILLARYAPACVLVDEDMNIVQFRGATNTFLEHPSGQASLNLFKMAREGLGFELRNLIRKVKASGKVEIKTNLPVKMKGRSRKVKIEVVPLRRRDADSSEALYMVLFEETQGADPGAKALKTSAKNAAQGEEPTPKEQQISELERELVQLRADMNASTEEQETTNEELQSTNEEFQSSNEELQSTNEELETSKEELDSTNEELESTNKELQASNTELSHSQHYTEAIIETMREPLLVLESNLQVVSANNAFYKLFKQSKSSVEGRMIYSLGDGQWDIPELRTLLEETLTRDNVFNDFEVAHNFPKLGKKVMILNGRRLDGLKRILLVIGDITEKKRLERQKDEFLSIASHELKNPIFSLGIYAQLLQKDLEKAKAEKSTLEILDIIRNEVERLSSLVKDLLNTDTLGSGDLVVKKAPSDMDQIVKKVIASLQPKIGAERIIKTGSLAKKINIDERRIERVLVNLLTNAKKYSPKDSQIIVRLSSEGKHALVSVEDAGRGIAKKDQEKIFERFYRIDRKEVGAPGSLGLGLYIVREIVSAHGGEIWVESQRGKGSTFYFTLPF